MKSKSQKRAKTSPLSKEAVRSIWTKLENTAAQIDKHNDFRVRQEAIESKARLKRKVQNKQIHASARADREANEREEAELAYKVPSERKRAHSPPGRITPTNSPKHELEEEISATPLKNLFEFAKVTIPRDFHAEFQRSQLPVIRHEQEIMESIFQAADRTCVVVSGDTGTGKTTQVPQFLWEYGFPAMIGVTQPRRVAVYAMANRLRVELGVTEEVGYQVRHEKSVDPERTKLKFMTEGILLREIQQDFALRQYSALIIDEVHERSVDCDILLGLLSRIIPLRHRMGKPLAVILMSATMNTSIFTDNRLLFPHPPPVITVESRRFELSEHYALRSSTLTSYLDDAFDKCVQIHTRLPYGAILCFVPTQKDCEVLSRRLQAYFQVTVTRPYREKTLAQGQVARSRKEKHDLMLESTGEGEFVIEENKQPEKVQADNIFELSVGENSDPASTEDGSSTELDTLYAVPLYANLDDTRQRLVFSGAPAGKRLCVIATNVAETSLTIPDVRYVVDTGFVKERNYDTDSNTYRSHIVRISMSSARQRAGRAGRTMPGHVYRQYTPGCLGHFAQDATPEIDRTPIERVVLLLSVFQVAPQKFPFPSKVSEFSISCAVERLEFIGALEGLVEGKTRGTITELGREIIRFPIVPRFAAILVKAVDLPGIVLHYLIDAIAVASSTVHFFQKAEDEHAKRHQFITPGSDYLSYARFLDAFRRSRRKKKLCKSTGVSYRVAVEASKLSGQIHRMLAADVNRSGELRTVEEVAFRKALCRGFLDCIAKKQKSADGATSKASYMHGGTEYRLHPSSHCARVRPAPDWVLFSTIESGGKGTKRLCGLTIVTMAWLMELGYDGALL